MLVTVSQLNNYIRGVVDTDSTLSNIEVSGEVTGAKLSHGYWFFAVKDEYCQFDCFAFANRIETVTNGMQVIASGSVNFLPKSGRMSLTVMRIVEVNQGASYLQYIELKNKLDKLGLFDIARKKSLPYMPKQIGVVTSQTGAVIQDITEVVSRRQPFSDIVLYPVKVQGEGAISEIVTALQYMSTTDVDVVILARGGGSNEDLAVFNDEGVVLALANCTKPTISAIGHGVDYTLCDMVADIRAVTPTEAGELATVDSVQLVSDIQDLLVDMDNTINYKVNYTRQNIVANTKNIVYMYANKVALTELRIVAKIKDISSDISAKIESDFSQVNLLSSKMQSNNPRRLASLGYYAVYSSGHIVTSNNQLAVGQEVQITMEGGSVVSATITKIDEK